MPLAQYGQTNPKGIEPWPIESTLAPLATGGSRAEAQNMLGHYQIARDTQEGQYEQDLAQQHQYAYDQLHQQLYEANLKGLAELKDPSVLQIAANAPGYQQLFGGAGSGAISDALARSQAGQSAKTFESAGKGAEGFSNAGYMVGANAIPGLPPGAPVTQTENARIAAERIRAGAMVQAAALRAAGGVGSGPSSSVQITDPNSQLPMTVHYPGKMTPAQVQTDLRNRGVPMVDTPPPQTSLPPAAQDTGPASAPPTPPTPTAAPSTASPAATAPTSNAAAGKAALQQRVMANLDKAPANARADIQAAAAKNGNAPVVGVDAQGPFAVGASGQKYR